MSMTRPGSPRNRSRAEEMAPIEEIIAEARNGRMFVLVDDEARENEGDLVIPAQFATPDAVNFMARYGRGLICLALTAERIRALGLTKQDRRSSLAADTAFMVSIEASSGVTTGISAADRSRTIQVAIDPRHGPEHVHTPGHVFPLQSRDGGVLVRAGHTEAAVDIARLAGLNPAGVICEIMKDDGSMARLPDLLRFARRHRLKIGTIADLIAHRLQHDRIIRRLLSTPLDSRWGGLWDMVVYANDLHYSEHFALIKGDIATPEPVLVRVHAHHLLNDMLGDRAEHKDAELQRSMEIVAQEGRGVVLLIYEHRPYPSERIRRRLETPETPSIEFKEYGVGAQVLRDLGLHDIVLLTNSPKLLTALEGFGIRIVGQRPIP